MRINRIVEMIKGGDVLLDIGTDHGEVIIEAFKRGYIKKAIATDINEGPLKRAYLNISNAGLLDKVKFIRTDGFNNINEWYNVVNITGLGYNTVREILEKPHKRPKFYVFGVQSEIEAFRKFLSDSGYKIIGEELVFDKKFYVFIKTIFASEKLSEEDIILGPILKTKKESIPYYKNKITKLKRKVPHYEGEKLEQIKQEINIYLQAIKNLQLPTANRFTL